MAEELNLDEEIEKIQQKKEQQSEMSKSLVLSEKRTYIKAQGKIKKLYVRVFLQSFPDKPRKEEGYYRCD